MVELNSVEARVLGVLVEKSLTTPAQYPLSLNALVTGSNQRSNREPVMHLDEEKVLDATDALRAKGFVREAMLSGSRVIKYRHISRETLDIPTGELVLLAELMLRGPQTSGELRQRASRMHPIESLEVCESLLASLMGREEPLVERLPPAPGSRAARFAQLLAPGIHPKDAPAAAIQSAPAVHAIRSPSDLEQRVAALEGEVARLKVIVEELAR